MFKIQMWSQLISTEQASSFPDSQTWHCGTVVGRWLKRKGKVTKLSSKKASCLPHNGLCVVGVVPLRPSEAEDKCGEDTGLELGNPTVGQHPSSAIPGDLRDHGRAWGSCGISVVKVGHSPGFLSSHLWLFFINLAKMFLNSFMLPASTTFWN